MLAVCAALIAFGFLYIPLDLFSLKAMNWIFGLGYGIFIVLVIGAIGTLPLWPALALIFHLRGRRLFGPWFGGILAFLALGPIGLIIVFLWVIFSGPASEIKFYQAVAFVLCIAASVLLVTRSERPALVRAISGAFLVPPAMLAIWSLSSVPAVVLAANKIAEDKPFCVAFHQWDGAIKRFSDLRGTVLITSSTGYKDTSRWFWHGIMEADGQLYNWSPRYRRFDKIPYTNGFLARPSPRDVCKQVENFWAGVGWY